MKTFMIVALILTMMPHVVHGNAAGAPNAACTAISPDQGAHGAAPQGSASPFTLSIYGSPTYYVPGCQYWLTFDRMGNPFRGFLIMARDMSDMNVGNFTAGTNQRQACSDMNGITHTNGNVDKTSVNLTWTAPAAGAGPITFRYAGVVMRVNYWANQMGPMLNESNSTTCPEFPTAAPTSSSPSTLSATFMTVAVLVVALLAMMI